MAKAHPEKFDAFLLIWRGTEPNKNWLIKTHYCEPANADDVSFLDKAMGLAELGKMKLYEGSKA